MKSGLDSQILPAVQVSYIVCYKRKKFVSVVLFIFKGEKWCEKMQLNPNSRFLHLRFVAFQVYFLWSWRKPEISTI